MQEIPTGMREKEMIRLGRMEKENNIKSLDTERCKNTDILHIKIIIINPLNNGLVYLIKAGHVLVIRYLHMMDGPVLINLVCHYFGSSAVWEQSTKCLS